MNKKITQIKILISLSILILLSCNRQREVNTNHIENQYMSFEIPDTWVYSSLEDSSNKDYPIFIIYDTTSSVQDNIFSSLNIVINVPSFENYINEEIEHLKQDIQFNLTGLDFTTNNEMYQCKISANTFDNTLKQRRELLYFYYYKENNIYILLFNAPHNEIKSYKNQIDLIHNSINIKPIRRQS